MSLFEISNVHDLNAIYWASLIIAYAEMFAELF